MLTFEKAQVPSDSCPAPGLVSHAQWWRPGLQATKYTQLCTPRGVLTI
jgi:hypothetical protein